MPRRGKALVSVVLALGAGLAVDTQRASLAQVVVPRDLPGAVEPGRDRPVPQAPPQTPFDFTIEAPSRSQVPHAVEELHFKLRDIRIEGAKTLPPETFPPLYQDLVGKDVTVANILDIADAIEDEYRRAGYLLTHAFVPPQRVRDGVFTIAVVEGFVASVTVEGGDAATQELVKSYLRPVLAAHPLDLATMERGLLLANDLAGVTASGVLRPSPTVSGAADLVVNLATAAVSGGLALDNRGSQFQGVWTLGGDLAANGLWRPGDQLAASYTTSPNVLEKTTGQVRYRAPIGSDGLVASVFTAVTHGEPGGSLTPLNVVTDSYAVGPRLSYPLWRGRDESLQFDGGLTVQDAKVTLLGDLQQSHDQWRVLDISATYSRLALGGAWTGGIDLAQGIGVFGATTDIAPISGETSFSGVSHGNPEFTKISGTLHHTRQIYGPISFALAAQAQYAFAPLVAGEQAAYGGAQIGRGYDPAAITGDHGIGGAFELRWDERLPDYFLDLVQPYTYFDTAKVWNRHGGSAGLTVTGTGTAGTGSGASIASVGAGVRFFFPLGFTADIEVSRTLRAVPGSDNGKKATKILTDAAFRF